MLSYTILAAGLDEWNNQAEKDNGVRNLNFGDMRFSVASQNARQRTEKRKYMRPKLEACSRPAYQTWYRSVSRW